jgi:hypothetical protein
MTYSTGNVTRDKFILDAITKVQNAAKPTPMGVATVSFYLPKGFDLDRDELTGILSTLQPEPARLDQPADDDVSFDDGEPVPFDAVTGLAHAIRPRQIARVSESLEKIEAPRAPESEPPHNDAAKSSGRPVTAQQMHAVVNAAQRRLEEARLNVRLRTGELQAKRTALAKAISAWQANAPVPTWEENARAHVAHEQTARAARIAAGGPATSATARAFVQKRMQGGGPNRGALNQAQRARLGFVVPGSPAAMAPRDYQADVRARAGLTKPAPQNNVKA